jgi:hypothetical protein
MLDNSRRFDTSKSISGYQQIRLVADSKSEIDGRIGINADLPVSSSMAVCW